MNRRPAVVVTSPIRDATRLNCVPSSAHRCGIYEPVPYGDPKSGEEGYERRRAEIVGSVSEYIG